MRSVPLSVQRFLWKASGGLAVAAALAGGTPLPAADAPLVPAKRPPAKAPHNAAPAPRANVRVISIPLQECPADDNEGMNAVKAFIDPATGELRAPTPEEREALARALAPAAARRAQAGRQAYVAPDGTLSYEVGEDGMVDAVARLGPDGKTVFSCTPRSETPKALTRPPAATKGPAAVEER